MASQLPEVIDEALLSCPLCLKPQCEPKILPCLHTFCAQCIKDYVARTANQNAGNQVNVERVANQQEGNLLGEESEKVDVREVGNDELDVMVSPPPMTPRVTSSVKSPVTSPVTSPSTSPPPPVTSSPSSPPVTSQSRSPVMSLVISPSTTEEIPRHTAPTPPSSLPLHTRSFSQENILSPQDSVRVRKAALRRRSHSAEFSTDAPISRDTDSGICSEDPRESLGGYVYPVSTPSPGTTPSEWSDLHRSPTGKSPARQADSLYQEVELKDLEDPFTKENADPPPPLPASNPPINPLPVPVTPTTPPPLQPKQRRHSEKPKIPPKPTPLKRWSVTKNSKRYKTRPTPPTLTRLSMSPTNPAATQETSGNTYSEDPTRQIQPQVSGVESTTNDTPELGVVMSPSTGDTTAIIPCPVCQFPFKENELNLHKLKTCHFISRLQDFVMTQSSTKRSCGNCETASANFHCFDCEQYLCSGCRDAHKWLKVTREHKVKTLRELQSEKSQQLAAKKFTGCNLHSEVDATQFCATCNVLMCDDCRLVTHPHHACGELTAVAQRDKDLLQQLLEQLESKSEEFQQAAKTQHDYARQCASDKDNLVVNITAQKERLYLAIEECFTELMEQISERYTEEIKVNSVLEDETQTMIKAMQHTKKLTNQLMRHGQDSDVIAMTTLLKGRLQHLQDVTPRQRLTTMEMDFYPAIPDLLSTMPMYGRVVQRNIPITAPTQPSPAKQRALLEEKLQRKSSSLPKLLHCFKARTDNDTKGCKPTGIAILPNDNIAIVDDINKKVKLFTKKGKLRSEICPTGEHKLIDPWDITLTKSSTLAVTDKGAKCVKEFTTNGDFVKQFGPHLKSPWGITCNSKGQLIVTDTSEKTVFVHDDRGQLQFSLPKTSCKLKCPEYVTVNRNDDIIVSDFEKHRVFVFDSLGRLLFKIGQKGRGLSQFYVPCGVAVDAEQNILVCDYSNQRVSMIDRNGCFKRNVLNVNNLVVMPQAVDITSRGHVVVADGAHVKVFRVNECEQVIDPKEEDVVKEVDKYYNATYGSVLIDNPNNSKKVSRETTV